MDNIDKKVSDYNKGYNAHDDHNKYASSEIIKFMEKIDVELKFIKEVLEEIKGIAKQQGTDIYCLPEKMIERTDKLYATKIELERFRSKLNYYAWLMPIVSAVAAFLAGRYL